MRGENRDYIPKRQSGVKDSTCSMSEGCAFKAESSKRDPFYKEKGGKLNDEKRANDPYLSVMGDY